MRWYDQKGIIKPEYKAAIAHLERIAPEKKLAPAGTGANNAKSDTVEEKPSIDAVSNQSGFMRHTEILNSH